MDRREGQERRGEDRRQRAVPVARERRSGGDRRSGDERRVKRSINQYDLGEDVLEFIGAVNRFKERSGRAFPTWSEVLEILKGLGYEKRA
jgi:hypothetical protein